VKLFLQKFQKITVFFTLHSWKMV